RDAQDADVHPRACNASDQRTRSAPPAFGRERNAIGPHAADAESSEKPQQQQLLLAGNPRPGAAKQRIDDDAYPQRRGTPTAIAQRAKPQTAPSISEAVCQANQLPASAP